MCCGDYEHHAPTALPMSEPESALMAVEIPARAMGWKTKGWLEVGLDAELVVQSPDLKVLHAFCGGEPLYRHPIS